MTQGDDKVKFIMSQRDELKNARCNFDTTFEDIARYMRPERQGIITKKTEGERRTDDLYDSTAIHALIRSAAVMRYMLTDVNTEWFFLSSGDEDRDSDYTAKEWLDDTASKMRMAFYSSNFSPVSDEFYLDLKAFATACFLTEEGRETMLNFRTISCADFVFTEDDQGKPDATYCDYEYTVSQAIKKFGINNLHKDIVDAAKDHPNKKFKFIHCVMRRDNVDISKIGKLNMPWGSYWIDEQHKELVSESGYYEQPYSVVRERKSSNTAWGYGPGMTSLPDVIELNDKLRTAKILRMKNAEPAYWAEEGSLDGPLRLNRNHVNWGKKGSNPPQPISNINNTGLQFILGEIAELKDSINDAFMVSQLSLIDRTKMTATEVLQRTEENMRIMGPTFERLVNEWLSPVITRVFGIMFRANMFKPVPDVLRDVELDIKYESPLARAQKGQQLQSMASALMEGAQLAQITGPDVFDRVDSDAWFSEILRQRGIPTKLTHSDDLMMEQRMARQQAQQEQSQMAALQAGVQTAKDASQIEGGGEMTGAANA